MPTLLLPLLLPLLLHPLAATSSSCIDTIAGGGGASSSAADASVQFALNSVAASPSSDNVFMASLGSVFARLGDGSMLLYAGASATTSSLVSSDDKGAQGPAASTALGMVRGLSFAADGSLVLVSDRYVRVVDPGGMMRVVAGTGRGGDGGDGGPATAATFTGPSSTAVDTADGSIYVADVNACRVRKILPNGTIVAFVGTSGGACAHGGDGGPATSATLAYPAGLAVHPADRALFITDAYSARVRRVDRNGTILTVAGTGVPGYSGDGGAATAAEFAVPAGLALDPTGGPSGAGVLYISDYYVNVVRGVDLGTGIIRAVAGSGAADYRTAVSGSPALSASLPSPAHLAVTRGGSLLIHQEQAAEATVVTFPSRALAGTGAGSIYPVTTTGRSSSLTTPEAFAAAGDVPALSAIFRAPSSVVEEADGSLLIAESGGRLVRRLSPAGLVSVAAGTGANGDIASADGGPARSLPLFRPFGLVVLPGGGYAVSDSYNNVVYRVWPNETATRLAGTSFGFFGAGFSGDGGPARQASLNKPAGLAVDGRDGGLLIADSGNYVVRKVWPNGTISTVAGTPGASYDVSQAGGDGGPAALATLGDLFGICAHPTTGVFYLPDAAASIVRRVDPATGLISTVAGMGRRGYGGDGGNATAARLTVPVSCSVDPVDGGLFIADGGNARVRKVSVAGIITTVVGSGVSGFGGDGGDPLDAALSLPSMLIRDSRGDLVLSEFGNNRVRRILTGPRVPPCPAGYTCACITATPCLDSASFCPEGSSHPTPASAGFAAVGTTALVQMGGSGGLGGGGGGRGSRITIFASQAPCAAGYYCPGATAAQACKSGTFGSDILQAAESSCVPCARGFYLGSAGTARSSDPAAPPPCLPCPAGFVAAARNGGASSCFACQPGMTTAAAGQWDRSACTACPASTVSLFGASECVRVASSDTISVSGTRLQFQRVRLVDDISGNVDDGVIALRVLYACIPIVVAGLVGAMTVLALPVLPHAASSVLAPVVSAIDLVSMPGAGGRADGGGGGGGGGGGSGGGGSSGGSSGGGAAVVSSAAKDSGAAIGGPLRAWEDGQGGGEGDGEAEMEAAPQPLARRPAAKHHRTTVHLPPLSRRTGTLLTILTVTAIACVGISLVVQFTGSNVQVQTGLQTATPARILSFLPLPPAEIDVAAESAAGRPPLDGLFPGLRSGLLVEVRVAGPACATLIATNHTLMAGSLSYARVADNATGAMTHRFSCASCVPDDLSALSVVLDGTCQRSLVVTAAAVGAWGSVTATSLLYEGDKSGVGSSGGGGLISALSLSVPVAFEVVQDSANGAVDASKGGIVAGGYSARGLGVGAATDLVTVPVPAAEGAKAASAPFPVTVLISLPLQPTSPQASLDLKSTASQFVSSLSGLTGFFSVSTTFMLTVQVLGFVGLWAGVLGRRSGEGEGGAGKGGGAARGGSRVAPEG
jgi:hypothetical protein